MENVWLNISSILLVFTVAIVSPGPNLILVVNRSLTSSRRNGVFTAFGVATGSGLFAIAGLLGLIVLISTLPYFSTLSRYIGGGYLIYLGATMLLSYRQGIVSVSNSEAASIKPAVAYCNGLLSNLTNPKAWAFYLSLFSLFVSSTFPLWAKAFLAVTIFLISFSWYAGMALLVSDHRIRVRIFSFQPLIKSLLGSLLLLLGGRLLLRG